MVSSNRRQTGLEKLLQIMAMLRDKAHGCPWDLEQSMNSLTRYTLEEVYEVVDAIESGDVNEIRDELGDLLFQIVFYAQIAREEGLFDFDAVAEAIAAKLIRRHPHVFGEGKLENFGNTARLSAGDVVVNWEAIKQQERQEKHDAIRNNDNAGLLNDIPLALPALARAMKIQKRAATAGFDWPEPRAVLAKLREELAELEEAMENDQPDAIAEEMGDVLFSVVNLSRHLSVDPEYSLRGCNQKFESRFGFIERKLANDGKSLGEVSLEELDACWDLAKQEGY